ncbi:hypothetical protein YC2023_079810 [Brassica napus]
MDILLCCLRVPEQDGESRKVLRTSAFSYPISNNFLLKTEYTEDNPKIVLQCGRIFHLACIYEWMERSKACPFCSKKMLFLEGEITDQLE